MSTPLPLPPVLRLRFPAELGEPRDENLRTSEDSVLKDEFGDISAEQSIGSRVFSLLIHSSDKILLVRDHLLVDKIAELLGSAIEEMVSIAVSESKCASFLCRRNFISEIYRGTVKHAEAYTDCVDRRS